MKNLNYHKIVDITMMILFPRIWICKVTTTHPATPVEAQKKTFPFSLIRAIALLVSLLFSYLTATPAFGQEPVGVKEKKEVLIGRRVPKDFWTTEHLFYINGDTIRKTLEEHRGKMLVLDFWFSGCAPCLMHQKDINEFKKDYPNDIAVIMVNSKNAKEGYDKLNTLYQKGTFEKYGIFDLSSIIDDTYLTSIFPYTSYPHYIWINHLGILQLRTYRNLLDKNYVAPFIDLL